MLKSPEESTISYHWMFTAFYVDGNIWTLPNSDPSFATRYMITTQNSEGPKKETLL